jgi:hypothetical protein
VSNLFKNTHKCVFFALALLLVASSVWGQLGTSTVRGTLTDPQGKSISGATVTIKNASTNYSRSMTSTSAGGFSFELLPVGDYTIEVEAKGFRKQVITGVHALVGTPLDFDVHMEIGQINQVVRVEAASAAVSLNTQDASLGNNLVNAQINALPMLDRTFGTLLTLQPGVSFNADAADPSNGAVNGARSDQSNLTLDGIDVNEAQTNRLDSPVLRLNAEAIEEFRLTTLNAPASQGRSAAAQVNLVSKSGTNQWHGAGFEFYRSTGFHANTFFNNRSGVGKPALIRHTFGGALGGPIIKDKLFFFYSFEGQHSAQSESVVRVVPLPSMGQGTLNYRDAAGAVHSLTLAQMNQVYPLQTPPGSPQVFLQMNPAALAVLANAATKYVSNDSTVGDSTAASPLNTAGFRFNAPTPKKFNSHSGRFDWRATSKQSLFVRFNWIYDHSQTPSRFPDTPSPTLWSHPIGVAVSHVWTINSNWVNNLRYGLTHQAFSQLGDSASNAISFRFIFQPANFSRTLSRTTPVHNFVDDVSWVRGKHTFGFGGNIRLIRNNRDSFSNSFDSATTNPSGYKQGGNVVSDPIQAFLTANSLPANASVSEVQNAATALIGRYSGFVANLNYGPSGALLSSGSPSARSFATQAYETYFQDAWKITHDVTLTLGLRYSLGRPVYETHGFEVKPNIPLSTYFDSRVASAAVGVSLTTPISLELSGPVNGKSNMYPWDKNDIQPRVGIAWSPSFKSGFLAKLFGGPGRSSIRAGYSILNDYFGEALATFFDLNNALGFSSSDIVPVNTFTTTNIGAGNVLAPPFTGFNQNVRALFPAPGAPTIPGVSSFSTSVSFPLNQPLDMGERIESSLDSRLHSPTERTWSLTVERQLPAGLLIQASYVGRLGRSLLAKRDAMALNNLVDPATKMDWYTAATILEKIRATRPTSPADTALPFNIKFQVPTMAYFDNVFGPNLASDMNVWYFNVAPANQPSCAKCIPANFTATQAVFWIVRNFYGNDWTDAQADIDQMRFLQNGQNPLFFNPQYGALSAWSTVGNSAYHGLAVSIRQRLGSSLTWDLNYTWSHSFDDASGLQSEQNFGGDSLILNPIRQHDNYVTSSFDEKHVINLSAIYQLPFGKGKRFGKDVNRTLDTFIGGWQLSGILRWNTGLPIDAPSDDARWATNWNVQSATTLARPLEPCVTKGGAGISPKFFGCDTKFAYQSFRNAFPGETGQRNIFRLPGYSTVDMGLSKSFTMPYNEKHQLQLRWEVFDVANHQQFGPIDGSRTGYGMRLDPLVRNLTPPTNWSNFTNIQGGEGGTLSGRRIMQIGARYTF